MSKSNKGDKVDQKIEAAANEFAPTIINDGGEDGTREVAPAPTPEASLKTDEYATRAVSDEELAARQQKEQAREFVTYVNGELSDLAEQLGYERIVLKPKATAAASGPVMLYHRVTEEGKVFPSRSAAGDDYISGDELNARRAKAE